MPLVDLKQNLSGSVSGSCDDWRDFRKKYSDAILNGTSSESEVDHITVEWQSDSEYLIHYFLDIL
jgi:hypothetical protein